MSHAKKEPILIKYTYKRKEITYKLHWFDVKPEEFLRKTMLFLGPSGTGKSVVMDYILYLIKHLVPWGEFISESNDANSSLDGMIPKMLTYDQVTPELLTEIYERQGTAANRYNSTFDHDTLASLCQIIPSPQLRDMIVYVNMIMNCTIDEIMKTTTDPEDREYKIDCAEKKASKLRVEIYREFIKNNWQRYNEMIEQLDPEYQQVIEYIFFNPNNCVYLDDCSTTLKKWKDNDETTLVRIFKQGRHRYFTLMYADQNDKNINSDITKNAFITIFTSAEVATSYVNNATNAFSADKKRVANAIIAEIFRDVPKGHPDEHRVLVYSRTSSPQFYVYKAKQKGNFRFCSDIVWEMDEELEKNAVATKSNSPYDELF